MAGEDRTDTAMIEPKVGIRDKALELGFDAVGFAPPDLAESASRNLAEYVARGYHGDMGWLADKVDRRVSPVTLWSGVKSVVVLALNYGPANDPLTLLERPTRGAISVYSQGRDYHDVIKKKLKALARWTVEVFGSETKVFVDTAPVMEKPLAERAGLGWQGKHTNLVSREYGSWLFLGELYTTLEIAPDEPELDRCGSCRRCLDVCPTAAFPAPYRLDARRCISYLTIEHKGHIPRELRRPMANRIYGCDDCLAVCPWNKFATPVREPALRPHAKLTAPRLAELARLDDRSFREVFAGTAIKRTGRDRFVRNVLIALGNSGDTTQVGTVRGLLGDRSPLVRAMAVWALSQLCDSAEFAVERRRHLPRENDADVRAEWGQGTP